MFCGNCGTKTEERSEFCQNCGNKTENSDKPEKTKKVSIPDIVLYYGKDWVRAKYFAISSLPHFDILITRNNFYLIQFPKTHGGTIGLILGLILFNILGAIIGTVIGNSSDRKKRENYRTSWLDLNQKIISEEYEKNAFIKISKDKLKSIISFKKGKFVVIMNGDETISLKKNKIEYEKFIKFIESYVL